MKINCNTVIIGKKLILVPYKKQHVEKYHGWMSSEEIREQTASEELSIEEEYENQQSWYEDEKKCTFIILDRDLLSSVVDDNGNDRGGQWHSNTQDVISMCGDVNIFFNDFEEEGTGELEIMIAEQNSRRKGIAKEALHLMMKYAIDNFTFLKQFIVKISENNSASIQLFKNLGFEQVGHVNVFKEINLILDKNNYKPLNNNPLEIKSWE
ncbi:N-acetyltransferase 9 [Tieghemostelium lacteum]|uniref:N-acetyltransferase 9-like protein n=1 Tax=Tieghemostelium lacteum TaxID=361077 RepID=A0A152A7K9_TIELA|nr:N-acetyltransferase 9 [Tieghemostelium lacteum]|eukprot:KYR02219.1 N-acetyltransferase 9 [Tieghemostelium lacteum]